MAVQLIDSGEPCVASNLYIWFVLGQDCLPNQCGEYSFWLLQASQSSTVHTLGMICVGVLCEILTSPSLLSMVQGGEGVRPCICAKLLAGTSSSPR